MTDTTETAKRSDNPDDEFDLAGKAVGWTPVEEEDPIAGIIRGSYEAGAGVDADHSQVRVVIDADDQPELIDTARERVEVLPS